MQRVTVSGKYQIKIPKPLREFHNIKPGGKFILMSIGNRIAMIPKRKKEDLRGALPRMDAMNEELGNNE